jgi:hypothetical protein
VFEEWAVRSGGCFTPPPSSTASLSGRVTLNDQFSTPVGGIPIDLLDANGNIVTWTTTRTDGTYSFSNLAPGTYSVVEDLSNSSTYYAVASAAGTVNGSTDGTTPDFTHITQVVLTGGNVGINYNFVDGLSGPPK